MFGKNNSNGQAGQQQVAKIINKASDDITKTVHLLTKTMCDYDQVVVDNALCDTINKIHMSINAMSGSIASVAGAINNVATAIDKGANALQGANELSSFHIIPSEDTIEQEPSTSKKGK